MKQWIKHVSLYVSLLMLVVTLFSSVVLANEPSEYFDGRGTQEDPFILSSSEDLVNLASLVNDAIAVDETFYYYQATYQLNSSIDLNTIDWVSIGTETTPFTGTFNGNGYIIYNLVGSTGLFNILNNATINRLTLDEITITSAINENTSQSIGALFSSGSNLNLNQITIRNTRLIIELTNDNQNYRIGGIGGNIQTSTTNSLSFLGNIQISSLANSLSDSTLASGLLFGQASNTRINNSSTSNSILELSATLNTSRLGGFVGLSSNITINTSQSRGIINADNQNQILIGGFVGDAQQAITINQSISTGSINASSAVGYIGGFIGRLSDNSPSTSIQDSYSRVQLTVSLVEDGFVGGLIGKLNGLPFILEHVYFAGLIMTSSNRGQVDAIAVLDDLQLEENTWSIYYDQTRLNGITSSFAHSKTTEQLKQQSTFDLFDFDQVWVISNSNNDGYPTLRYGRYLVQFNPDNNTTRADQLLKIATAPSNPNKSGYQFLYWSNNNGDSAFDFNQNLSEDVLLKAYYISDITVVINDSTPLQLTVENLENAIEFSTIERQQPVGIQLEFKIASITSLTQDARNTINDYMFDTYDETVSSMMFFEVTLLKIVGNNQTIISDTVSEVTLSFIVPARYRNTTFSLIHFHDNQLNELNYDYDANTQIITFVTDQFSTFSFVTTTPIVIINQPSPTPNTQRDYNWLYGWILLVLGFLIILGSSIRTIDE